MVDDKMLKGMAPHLQSLKRLTLWGCTRITREGVYEILRQAEDLDDLSLDALPHSVSIFMTILCSWSALTDRTYTTYLELLAL